MANYSTDSQMKKVDREIDQWLAGRADFSDIRNLVTARINERLKKAGLWSTLQSLEILTEDGLVDTTKLLNGADLEDLENTWVREIIYHDNIHSAAQSDAICAKAKELRLERFRLLRNLQIIVDKDGDGCPDCEPISLTKLHRA
jgi:hypothetical protein